MKKNKAPRVANASKKGRAVSVGSGALLALRPRKWFTETPCIPICSDMRLLRRKPKGKHIPVIVVPLTDDCINAIAHRMAEAFNGSYDGHLHITDLNAMMAAIGIRRRGANVKDEPRGPNFQ